MKEDEYYWIDSFNNRWSKNRYTKKQAEQLSKTLIDCIDCINCSYCRYCRYCNYCSGCSYCSNCRYCRYCNYCSGCSYCSNCNGFKNNPQRIVSDRIGSRNDTTTIYYYENKYHVVCGCFTGSLEEFKIAIKTKHGENKHAIDYFRFIDKAHEYFNKNEDK